MFIDTDRQLRKLSIFKPMKFQVTYIDFDFRDEDYYGEPVDPIYKAELLDETIGQIWEASDEDDLIEEITSATGWCINSIDYRYILS